MGKNRWTGEYLVFAILLFCSTACFGQSGTPPATGTPPFGSFGGGPDIINLANLNSHLTVPVFNRAGRGIPFTYNINYDTSVLYPVTSGSTTSWQPVNNWGWQGITEPINGYLSAQGTTGKCSTGNPKFPGFYAIYKWTFRDSSGVAHIFPNTTEAPITCGNTTSVNSLATDGSGYLLQATGDAGNVISRGGLFLLGLGTQTIDNNGNEITVNGSNQFTDTLGSVALTVSGAPPNPVMYTYTNPQGSNSKVTVKYTSSTVRTNFACSGIVEYSASNVPLVTEIDLPDGTNYKFTYEATPSFSGDVTGRLASVTLPTGGTINYTYTGSNHGIECSDGSAAGLTRSTPDGTWTYARSLGTPPASTTTVTDPQSNQAVINFQGIYETERLRYQGSTSGTLLKFVVTCYNGNLGSGNCNAVPVTVPIAQRTVFSSVGGVAESRVDTFYNSSGLLTEKDEYGFANGVTGPLVRKTLTTYATLGNYIVDRAASVTVEDGSGNVKAQTTYGYDQGAPAATSGTPQHVAISGARGNVTTISSLVSGSTILSKTFAYFDTGNVYTATDVNGAVTTYTYGDCGNSFATLVSEPLNLSQSMAWNCTGGAETLATDENGKTTTLTYNDPYFWRLNAATDPASNQAQLIYNGATSRENFVLFNGGASTADSLLTFDDLGRTHVSQIKQGPSSTMYDSSETDYDSLGRPSKSVLPYSGTAGETNSSGPGVTTSYDALSRPLQVTDSGGGTTTYSYNQNDVLVTSGPAPSGENTKRKQYEYDALGRITSVCEITSASGSGTCGQTAPVTGYWTKYTYDVLNNLTGVTQNAQGTQQTRAYTYDDLSRMISETNPESGTTTYVYDTDSTCGTFKGDLVKKMDAAGNLICYSSDALHRVIAAASISGPYSGYPSRYFIYDAATVNGQAMQLAKGRVAEAYTATCQTCSKVTDLGFSYNALGQTSDVYESTPHSSGYYHLNSTYFPNGVVNVLGGLSGLPTITYNVDGEGRPLTVSAGSGQNPVTSTSYNPASRPTAVNFGSLDSDSFTYDSNTTRMTQYKFNVNGQSVVGALTWNANGTLQTLGVTDPFLSADNQTCTYAHDDLSRIASVNCTGSAWSQTFSYDAFGNISKSGSMPFQASYLNNRMTEIGGNAPSYDANGNVTNDFLHTYAWDINGRPVTIDTVGVTYDALGRMVEQNRSGAYQQIVYSPSGAKLALMNGTSLSKAFVPLPGGAAAVYNSSGLAYYRHSDWLGSSRFASTPARAMYFDGAYAPFGEPYGQTGTTDLSFTGINQDTVPALYDFPAREYGIQGRWPSPDPAGLGAVDPANPQSWNRYAYVRNNPTSRIDPSGTVDINPGLMYAMMSGGGGFGCQEDGLDVSCESAYLALQGGGAVQCPNNNCGIGTATPYQCLDTACGYMSYQYAGTHENEQNGVLYSDSEWAQFISGKVDSQHGALAGALYDAIMQANPNANITLQGVYNDLVPQGVNGGNADFTWTGDSSYISFIPHSDTGGCEFTCRVGSFPSIHMDHWTIHLDTGNPMWGFGLGFFVHLFVDMGLGNINPSVPF